MNPRMAMEAAKVIGATVYRLWGPGPGGFVYTQRRLSSSKLLLYNVQHGEEATLAEGPVRIAAGSQRWVAYALGRPGSEALEIHDGEEAQPVSGFKPGKVIGLAVGDGIAAASVSTGSGVEVRLISLREAMVAQVIPLEQPFRVEAVLGGYVLGVEERSGFLGILSPGEARLHLARPPGGGRVKQVRAGDGVASVLVSNIVDEIYMYGLESGFRGRALPRHNNQSHRIVEVLDHGWLNGSLWMIARGHETCIYMDGKRVNVKLKGNPRRAAPAPGGLAVEYSGIAMPSRIALVEYMHGKARVRGLRGVEKPQSLVDARVRETHIESRGSIRVPLLVAEPRGSRRSAAVVYVHEGPWSRARDEWDPVAALLLLLGYRIVAPNYRGSAGEGRHYADLIVGDPGGGDLDDVIGAVQWAKSTGLGETVYLVGRGYGGYLALLAATGSPGLARGVAVENPIVSWVDEASSGDVEDRNRADILFEGDTELMSRRSLTGMDVPRARLLIVASPERARSLLTYAAFLVDSGVDLSLHIDWEHEERFLLELALFLGKAQGN